MNLMNYDDMKVKTIEFYNDLKIKIPKKYIVYAIQSMTMAQYAKQYKDKNHIEIKDHRPLATVGDAVCGAYLMKREFIKNDNLTAKELTNKKVVLTNENLNELGMELVKENLFYANNDLKKENKKSYATAFEAVIGFVSLMDMNKAFKLLDKYMK